MHFAFQRGRIWLTLLLVIVGTPIVLAICGALGLSLALLLANDRLPSMDALTDYKPKVPLRIFTSDGVQIGEFGEERRSLVKIADVPPLMKNAILAAEDSRFFEHGGVDYKGIVRAGLSNVVSGGKEQGASTITMQLARNFFLSTEKSYSRKIYEILVALMALHRQRKLILANHSANCLLQKPRCSPAYRKHRPALTRS
jgi:penicillin-binding protein 1A